MLYFNENKNNCTGCTACFAVCPQRAIKMIPDEFGFLYPVSDESCTMCGSCRKVCPQISNNSSFDFCQFAVAGIHKDLSIWEKSTSGGAFTAICQTFGDKDTYIFGACFNEFDVIHKSIRGIDKINIFRKSKYVQSSMEDCYKEVENKLINHKKVIFTGVGCQIAGLKKYLSCEYDTLLCVDLICTGVGSPKVFKKYIDELEKKYRKKIVGYTFRNKKIKFGHIDEYISCLNFEDNKKIYIKNDLYTSSFVQGLHYRDSCVNCSYKSKNRWGDITIADFKKRVYIFPKMKTVHNLSAIIVNNKKGEEVYKNLERYMDIYNVDIKVIEKNLVPFNNNVTENPNRKFFMEEFDDSKDVINIMKKYNKKSSLLMIIWVCCPEKLRYKIKEFLKWIRK